MSNQKNQICISLLSFLCILYAFTQENSIYHNNYLDPFITNPACTGAEYYPVAHLSAEKQWIDFTDSPSTFLLSGNHRIGRYDFFDPKGFVNKSLLRLEDRIGIGAAIFQDNMGPLSNTGGILSYAYHLPVNKGSRLSFGLSVVMTYFALNTSILKPDQSNDNFLLAGNNSTFTANMNTGIYYHNNIYFIGASINKFLPGISSADEIIKELPSYFVMGGYRFNKNSTAFNLEPSLTIKKLEDESVMVDMHMKLYIKRLNWVAISYSTSQQINIQFGLRLYKMVYVGYNYGYTLTEIASYNYGTQQISLGINLGLIGIEGIRETIK